MNDTPAERGDDSIWSKLRRRRVAQWALAYAAGAWVLLQVLGFVSDSFAWPATVKQIATIVLAVGLPIVVVLGWYHGERGQRRVSGPELAVLTLLLVIGGGLLWLYSQRGVPTTATATAETPAPASAAVDGRPSIAVLPFDNRSRLEDDAFFVDGVHDDILTQLSKVSALRVISRTSAEQFRHTKLSMKAIAEQLGVTKILEGGVQRAGDRVRVTVQLIDAANDAHLWAESYDRELTAANIFAIQSEVAVAIAGALRATLTSGEKARVDAVPTQSLAAWEAYQLGKQHMARRTSESLADAESFFRKAIDLDHSFALAHAGLADTLSLQTDYSGKPLEVTLAKAEKAIAKALSLDPNLAEAWASKGGIAMGRAQNDIAESMLRRSIELNPNYATAHQWLSMVLRGANPSAEELEHAERAVQLDPLSGVLNNNLGNSLERMSRFDEAAARYRRAIELDPTLPLAYGSLANLEAYARNRFPDAVMLQQRAVALDTGNPSACAYLVAIYLDMDDAPRAKPVVSSMIERWPDDFYSNVAAAVTHQLLGERDAAELYAKRALAAYPRDPLPHAVLRNADLRDGELKAARARYASAYPELFGSPTPRVRPGNLPAALDLALVLQKTGELDRASAVLDAGEEVIRSLPRLGVLGYGIADAQVHALRGDKSKALDALREAEQAGWRGLLWRYYRDIDPNLASLRNEPEFKAIFADIEHDMAQQRARLTARPKDAPLELTDASR